MSSETINIFIGTSAAGEDAESQAVAEYTIRKHATQPVAITWVMLSKNPSSFWYGWNTTGWGTPFSGFRFGVPAYCGFDGKAIYLDGDIICMADIAELWNQPIPAGAFALVKGSGPKLRTCIMLIDCFAAQTILPDIGWIRRTKMQYRTITRKLEANPTLTAPFSGMWNCVDLRDTDGVLDPSIKIIHYSSQWEQIHLGYAVKRLAARGRKHWWDGNTTQHRYPVLQRLFDELLVEAAEAGYTPERYETPKPYGKYGIRSYVNFPAAKP